VQGTSVTNFFKNLASQNKRTVQEKSKKWNFDFEKAREIPQTN